MLQAAKNEARLAVDLYNRQGNERQLEAFLVHMAMAWLKLMQAHTQRTGGDLFIRDKSGRRVRHEDGDWRYKASNQLLKEHFADNDARKVNIEFFTGLRNRVEHRHENNIAALVAGRTQAHLLNFERTLVEWFGADEALASELRFPLFVSSITQDAVAAVKRVRSHVPVAVLEWIQDFDATIEPSIAEDQAFDFRIYLIPHKGPKTEADAAMTYVNAGDLTDEQNAVVDQVRTIIREKQVPVADLGNLRPAQVVTKVAEAIARPFTMHMHTQSWRFFKARPPSGAADKAATRADFCRWNPAFEQYVYTEAWVSFLVRKLSDEATYDAVAAYDPSTSSGGA
ncbi:DUF3644 domain-containing protein [Nocardioides caldifontis]|uniref:DUF3644 domain-containing protein n=1 Tax=Nocardioides caldifontis TaxID=2588938 RepID=UPI0013967DD3|nr:DUF3644 domain-containing protein [Nocardioides caldifontis]